MNNRTAFLLFPACAMSLGWAFRGFIGGGPLGAMIPGAMVALALAWLLGLEQRKDQRARVALVAAFGAVGIGFGGQMTYGQTVGLASGVATMPWGLFGLALKGAVWGLLGGATVGLAFTIRRYSRKQAMVALAAMLAATWAGWRLVNLPKLVYFSNRLDRPREELWAGLLAGAIVMLAVLWLMRSNVPLLRFALASFVGGGLGFGLGGALLAAGRNSALDPRFWPWWKGMEYTFGLLFGLALGWAAWHSRAELSAEGRQTKAAADLTAPGSPFGKGLPLLLLTALLVAFGVWFEYAGLLRFGYSVAGVALLVVALSSSSLAWHIAITMTAFAFLLDSAEAFAGDLAFGPMWLGVSLAVAGAVAIWVAVERIRRAGDAVAPRLFFLLTMTAFAVTTLKTAMQVWRAPGWHVEYWMFVAATFVVWRIYAAMRARRSVEAASGI